MTAKKESSPSVPKVKVEATIAYDDKGTRRYKTAIYEVQHWESAMTLLFATNVWNNLTQDKVLLIYGVTFAFKYE